MPGTITKSGYLALLLRTGERVGADVREAVPERSIITSVNSTPAGPKVTHGEMVQACAVTAGVIIGTVLDVFGIKIVDDPPESPPRKVIQ